MASLIMFAKFLFLIQLNKRLNSWCKNELIHKRNGVICQGTCILPLTNKYIGVLSIKA